MSNTSVLKRVQILPIWLQTMWCRSTQSAVVLENLISQFLYSQAADASASDKGKKMSFAVFPLRELAALVSAGCGGAAAGLCHGGQS